MAVFREFQSEDIKTDRDVLEQLTDVLQNDISSSLTRKTYQVWVTGGLGPGVTSSLFQTVFDQDFSLQTANPVFDVTFGIATTSTLISGSLLYIDANTNKYYFASQSIQMREKLDIYHLFAQECLGNASEVFKLTGTNPKDILEPLFISFKRIFTRDRIKRETFAIRMFQTSSNLLTTATVQKIYTDVGSTSNIETSFGGLVSTIVDSANTAYPVGLLYIDRGIVVLDTQRVFDTGTLITGNINGMSLTGIVPVNCNLNRLLVSASIDNLSDHICSTRFSSSAATAITFQNQTYINSTIFFCRFTADEFNYSSNPTYTDSTGRIVVIDPGQEETQRAFSYVTSIGLYDAYDNLLGVAKLSRPVYKDRQRDFTLKCRLDFFRKNSRTYITKSQKFLRLRKTEK